jgi:hydrogenase nickel incorporation protein HypB
MNRIAVEKSVLSENNQVAAELREALGTGGTLALNFIGSPGAGNTALLEKTVELLRPHTRAGVLTGDIQTDNDARRLMRYGYPVRQITTAEPAIWTLAWYGRTSKTGSTKGSNCC